jgi:hypothetical protein
MVEYSNGKIYKLVTFQSDDVYYGSTCSPLSKRLAGHRRTYKSFKSGKGHYITAFEILQYPDAQIILIESVNCASKEALHAAERKYIDSNACVNRHIPGRSINEWRVENKESLSAKKKQYYQDNKNDILETQKQYYQDNKARLAEKILCECGNYSTRVNFARHKRSKKHLKYLLSIAKSDTEEDSESSEYIYDGVPHKKIVNL